MVQSKGGPLNAILASQCAVRCVNPSSARFDQERLALLTGELSPPSAVDIDVSLNRLDGIQYLLPHRACNAVLIFAVCKPTHIFKPVLDTQWSHSCAEYWRRWVSVFLGRFSCKFIRFGGAVRTNGEMRINESMQTPELGSGNMWKCPREPHVAYIELGVAACV